MSAEPEPDVAQEEEVAEWGPDGDRSMAVARATKAAHELHERTVAAAVIEDPNRAMEELHGALTIATNRAIAKLNRSHKPVEGLLELIREFRLTTQVVTDYRKERGQAVEAEEFLASMATRMASLATDLPGGPRPLAVRPA